MKYLKLFENHSEGYVCEWKDTQNVLYVTNLYKCDQFSNLVMYINDYFSKHTKRH